eukprot:3843878-Rhodomonas_salina.2
MTPSTENTQYSPASSPSSHPTAAINARSTSFLASLSATAGKGLPAMLRHACAQHSLRQNRRLRRRIAGAATSMRTSFTAPVSTSASSSAT